MMSRMNNGSRVYVGVLTRLKFWVELWEKLQSREGHRQQIEELARHQRAPLLILQVQREVRRLQK